MSSATLNLQRQQLQQRLGHVFNDPALLLVALTHRSAGKNNNERLEFLGDSIVNHVVAERLYNQFPKASEGQLSRLRAKLVRGTYLATIALDLDLGPCLLLGTGERKSGGRNRDSILADTVEALAGAILLDADFETAKAVVNQWFDASFAQLKMTDERDPKTRLQEWLQGRGHPLPNYNLSEVTGPDHDQKFVVTCAVAPLTESVIGTGKSRREAEQSAATHVLEELERV